jgi:8-oxo-dGTP pyrophosphatase MutT (NUDIX family)
MNNPNEHRLTDQVKLLQKAVITSDGAVLLLKRASNSVSRPNCWDLPGGNSEWPVAQDFTRGLHLQDLVREIQEETGLVVSPDNVFQRDLIFFDTTFEPQKQMFTILVGWKHSLNGDTPPVRVSEEHTEFAWVNPDNLNTYDFGFAEFIPKMIRRALLRC